VNELKPLCPDAERLVPEADLPHSRFVPGLHPHPRRSASGSLHGRPDHTPGLPADDWQTDGSYLLGLDLYHQGYLWESHEAFEACFFAADERPHRELLQALIQLAAAELQLHRGIGNGVRILVPRVIEHLEAVTASLPPGQRLCGLLPTEIAGNIRKRFASALSEGGDPLSTTAPPVLLLPRAAPSPGAEE
jgi:hypothetical protein